MNKLIIFLLYPIVMVIHPQLRGYGIHKLTHMYREGEWFIVPSLIAIFVYPLLLLLIYMLTLMLWTTTQQIGAVVEDTKHSINVQNHTPIEQREEFDSIVVPEKKKIAITDEEYHNHTKKRTSPPRNHIRTDMGEIERMIRESRTK